MLPREEMFLNLDSLGLAVDGQRHLAILERGEFLELEPVCGLAVHDITPDAIGLILPAAVVEDGVGYLNLVWRACVLQDNVGAAFVVEAEERDLSRCAEDGDHERE